MLHAGKIPDPPVDLPEVGTITLVSFGESDDVQTVTVLVTLTPEANQEYLDANKDVSQ